MTATVLPAPVAFLVEVRRSLGGTSRTRSRSSVRAAGTLAPRRATVGAVLRHTATVTVALGLLVACDPGLVQPETESQTELDWEAFRAAHAHDVAGEEIFLVEGDLQIDEDALRGMWEDSEFRATHHLVGGQIDRWPAGAESQLRYCVSTEWVGLDHVRAQQVIESSARRWERLAHVDFVYVPATDAACVAGNPGVTFAVRPWTLAGAAAFLPSSPASARTVWLNLDDYTPQGTSVSGLAIHELGHVLGLRHENIRPEGGACADGLGPWWSNAPYDASSVMHHFDCPGVTQQLGSPSVLDAQAARRAYGPPKVVAHAPVDRDGDGVLEIGTLVDCDGDGDSDLVARAWDELVCARSNADGSFTASAQLVGGALSDTAVWGDFTDRGAIEYGALSSPDDFSMYGMGPAWSAWVHAPTFVAWAQLGTAWPVAGRFDADARSDVAIVGPSWWGTTPVLFGELAHGTPGVVVNQPSGAFSAWAAQPRVRIVPGDFDADGLTDIALVGGLGWSSVPVAFARGGGHWDVRNTWLGDFAGWASDPAIVVHAADLDGDGDSDLALTGPAGWGTIPTARSLGDGSFATRNVGAGSFPAWAAVEGVSVVAADFDGDGCGDLAATGGAGWGSIPLARSLCDGAFAIHNPAAATFAARAAAGPRPMVGDFDRDRRFDLVLVGEPGRTDVVLALGRGTSFEVRVTAVPEWTAALGRRHVELPPS